MLSWSLLGLFRPSSTSRLNSSTPVSSICHFYTISSKLYRSWIHSVISTTQYSIEEFLINCKKHFSSFSRFGRDSLYQKNAFRYSRFQIFSFHMILILFPIEAVILSNFIFLSSQQYFLPTYFFLILIFSIYSLFILIYWKFNNSILLLPHANWRRLTVSFTRKF